MKEFLKKIPILGKILRIGSCTVKAPQRFDLLFDHTESHRERLERLENAMPDVDELTMQIDELSRALDQQTQITNSFMSKIRVHSRLLEHCASEEMRLREICNRLGIEMDSMEETIIHEQSKRFNELEKWQVMANTRLENMKKWQVMANTRFESAKKWQVMANTRFESAKKWQAMANTRFESAKKWQARADTRYESAKKRQESTDAVLSRYGDQLSEVVNIKEGYLNKLLNCICHNAKAMEALNLSLSGYPTIWGDPKRLHISDSAAVYTCLFNTNSGNISVGDYTFAGSNVSILAGSHDMHLQGFLRRDAEITEGCDIKIGNGVWLASGCTLLGPCTVGDNAVIASGAVVIPGTVIPENTVYGGIPARQITSLDFSMTQDANNPHVQRAFDRNGGLLFLEGWSEKQWFPGIPCRGHWLKKNGATLLVGRQKWTMHYGLRDVEDSSILFECEESQKEYPIHAEVGELSVELPIKDCKMQEVTVKLGTETGKLFFMLVASDIEKR